MSNLSLRVNSRKDSADGASLQGVITITHGELVERLGEGEGSGDKTLDEWTVSSEIDGRRIVATIYDWKNYGANVEDITEWHIGGQDFKAVQLIRAIFPNKPTELA